MSAISQVAVAHDPEIGPIHDGDVGASFAEAYRVGAWAQLAIGDHESARSYMRQAASKSTDAERATIEAEVARLQGAIANATGERGRRAIDELRERIARLEGRPTDRDGFLFRELRAFVADLETFLADDVAQVETDLRWARHLPWEAAHHEQRWADARAAVRAADGVTASAAYASVPIDLAPQTGLVPIGMNPQTKLWEFYHLRSANPDRRTEQWRSIEIPPHDPDTGAIEVIEDTGIVFVLVPGTTFLMGAQRLDPSAPHHDPLAAPLEGPTHEVALEPYFIARHELTQSQWSRLARGDNPSTYRSGGELLFRLPSNPDVDVGFEFTGTHPVENVTWSSANRVLSSHRLDLPTEAQWEHAVRAGADTPWLSGADPSELDGWSNLFDRSAYQVQPEWGEPLDFDDGFVVHAPGRHVPRERVRSVRRARERPRVVPRQLRRVSGLRTTAGRRPAGHRTGSQPRPAGRCILAPGDGGAIQLSGQPRAGVRNRRDRSPRSAPRARRDVRLQGSRFAAATTPTRVTLVPRNTSWVRTCAPCAEWLGFPRPVGKRRRRSSP